MSSTPGGGARRLGVVERVAEVAVDGADSGPDTGQHALALELASLMIL
jgi:hypothetical protein